MFRQKSAKKPEKMLRRLRIKFFAIIMAVITIVFGSIFLGANFLILQLSEANYRAFSEFLIETDGRRIPSPSQPGREFWELEFFPGSGLNAINFRKNVPFDALTVRNFFSVKISPNGEIFEKISFYPIYYSAEEILNFTNQAFVSGQIYGNLEGLRFQLAKKDYGYIIVFVDRKSDDNLHFMLEGVFFAIYTCSIIFAFILTFILSGWALKPIKTAFVKQKQFVADASHELKTPLAVIGTNLDVLVGEVGENKWFGYIKGEVQRMSILVKDLLYLAKYDSSELLYEFKNFNLSRALTNATLPFESVAFEAGRTLEVNIEPKIEYNGDENRIKQLAIILLDNAIKNSTDDGNIKVTLKVLGSKKILSVYNTGDGLDEAQKKKIFERFYRSDVSRTRDTGGSGLGLSIAATIAQAHRAKITVTGKKGEWIEFTVVL